MADLDRPDDYLETARADARAVEYLHRIWQEVPEIICFHAEQAAKKMLKEAFVSEHISEILSFEPHAAR